MARMRMVTRTVSVVDANVLTVDVVTATPMKTVFTVSGVFENDNELLKALRKAYETETVKLVAVVGKVEREVLYGMPESEFIALATVLPPRKANEDTEE